MVPHSAACLRVCPPRERPDFPTRVDASEPSSEGRVHGCALSPAHGEFARDDLHDAVLETREGGGAVHGMDAVLTFQSRDEFAVIDDARPKQTSQAPLPQPDAR